MVSGLSRQDGCDAPVVHAAVIARRHSHPGVPRGAEPAGALGHACVLPAELG